MNFREFIEKQRCQGSLVTINGEVSLNMEASSILKHLETKPVFFHTHDKAKVAGNIFSTRTLMAEGLNIEPCNLTQNMLHALKHPSTPSVYSGVPPCQEVVENEVDLRILPILYHYEVDGGPYITSGIFVVHDKEYGTNLSYHRCQLISKDRFAIRVLPRHLYTYLNRAKEGLDAALVIGNPPQIALAAASSPSLGISEYDVAHTLSPFSLATAKTVDLMVPADSEYVLEGRILHETVPEGPFVDITETQDIVRPGNIFEVRKITHRKDPIYHALLPGGLEHKILMGLPKEACILAEVQKVCEVLAVNVTPGGTSWLHAVIQIEKRSQDDPMKAIHAAFKGHGSLKHAFIVDKDIDPFSPQDVEWAMATRFQADKKLIMMPGEKGSSLDPSADPITRETCKAGFDLTCPLQHKGKGFTKVPPPKCTREIKQ